MKNGKFPHSKKFETIVWVLILSHLLWCQTVLAQGMAGGVGSVALVSNVTGTATISHEGQEQVSVDASFKAPVVFGDRIQTGSQSMIAMLVGDDALVAMKEFSEMRVTEEPGLPQVIHLTKGQVCISTKGKGIPVQVEAGGTNITVSSGSMASIQISSSGTKTAAVFPTTEPQNYLHKTAMKENSKRLTVQANAQDAESVNISVLVQEGSVSLVSQVVGKAPVTVGPKQAVQVIGGTIGAPMESQGVYCQVQDLQQDPQHTATPEEIKDQIEKDQQSQANQLVALLSVGASAPESVVPPNIPIDNGVISTTDPEEGGRGQNIPTANPGDPLVEVGNSLLNVDSPFLVALPSQTTVNGPPFQLTLNDFSGSTTQINPSQVLQGLSPQVASQLFAAFRDPNNPDALLAGLRVQSSAQGGAAAVFGGLRLLNSQVQSPVEFIQIGQTGNTQTTEVATSGALLNLENSTFSGEATLIALRNGLINAQSSSQPLVMVSGQNSNLTLDGASFLTTNPSTVMSPNGVLSLTGGATSNITGSLIELDGSTLDGSGGQRALVTVENDSQLTVQGNLISATNGSTLIAPNGVLSLNNGQVTIQNDFMTISTSTIEAGNGLVTAANNSQFIIAGYLFALDDGANVITNGMPGVTLLDSALTAQGLLKMTTPGAVPTGLLGNLVQADTASTVTLTEAVVKVENTTGVTLASLTPLLNFLAPVALLIENSQVTVAGDLVAVNGTALALPGSGLVHARNSSTLTLVGYVETLSNNGSLVPNTPNPVPVVTLENSSLIGNGLLRIGPNQQGVNVSNSLAILRDRISFGGISQFTTTGAFISVEDNSEFTSQSTFLDGATFPSSQVTFGSGGPLLAVNNGLGTIQGFLAQLNGNQLGAPGGLLRVSGGQGQANIASDLVNVTNGGRLTGGGRPLVEIVQGGSLTVGTEENLRARISTIQGLNSQITVPGGLLTVSGAGSHVVVPNDVAFLAGNGTLIGQNVPLVQMLSGGVLEIGQGFLCECSLDNIFSRLFDVGDAVSTGTLTPAGGILNVSGNGSELYIGNSRNVGSNFLLGLFNGSTLNGDNAQNPLIQVSNQGEILVDSNLVVLGFQTVTTMLNTSHSFLQVEGGSTVFTNGHLFDMAANQLSVDHTLVKVQGSSLSSTGSFFSLTNVEFFDDGESFVSIPSTLTVNSGGLLSLVDVQGPFIAEAGESVLEMNESSLTADQTLITANNSQIMTGLSVIQLRKELDIIIATLTVTNGGLLELINGSNMTITNGGLLDAINETVSLGNTLLVLSQSSLTMSSGEFNSVLIDLERSSLSSSGSLLNLADRSSLTIQRGEESRDDVVYLNSSSVTAGQALVTGSGNSVLNVAGHLASMFNRSNIEVTNGGLLNMMNSLVHFGSGVLLMTGNSRLVSQNTLINLDVSRLSVVGTAFQINNASGFADDGENFVEGVRVTNGGVLSLSNGSQFGGGNVIDGKLLNATLPLFTMFNSTMATGSGFLDVNSGSNMTVGIPNDALVSLDASSLIIRNGSLINVNGLGSAVNITGGLVSLANGSQLSIANGALVSVSGNGSFTLTGGLVNFLGGSATNQNVFSVTNNACSGGGCVAPFSGFPDVLVKGTVSVTGSYNPFPGFSSGEFSPDRISVGPNTAVLINDGGTLTLNGTLTPGAVGVFEPPGGGLLAVP